MTLGTSASGGNPFLYYFPQDETNRTTPPAKTVSFVLDSPGTWKFRAQATDIFNNISGISSQNSIISRCAIWSLSAAPPAHASPPNTTRLVSLLQRGASPSDVFGWRPSSGRRDYKWGPNLVSLLTVDWASQSTPAKNTLLSHYLGWAFPGPF